MASKRKSRQETRQEQAKRKFILKSKSVYKCGYEGGTNKIKSNTILPTRKWLGEKIGLHEN